MTVVLWCVAAGVASGGMSFLSNSRPLLALWWFGFLTVFDTAMAAWNLVTAEWALAAVFAVCAVAAAWTWQQHRNRRKRRRAPALAGAKSRARVAALVRKMQLTAR